MLNVKKDFPIFKTHKDLVYLDNAATSQKPQEVIDAISNYYSSYNANVHRGIYKISEQSTEAYEHARRNVANLIGAASPNEVTFTKGATESLNRVAFEWAMEQLKEGDVLLTTSIEHHSNFLPWKIVSERTGAILKTVECSPNGELTLEDFKKAITPEVKFIAITHISNVLGTVTPVKEICKLAWKVGAKVSVDGAQAVLHMRVNVQDLGCDFYAFSSHKMLGPMGVGVLWTKQELAEAMPPHEYGGGMIKTVSSTEVTYATPPEKFEAGTPNVAGAVGLSSAIDYINKIGIQNIQAHDQELTNYAMEKLSEVKGLKILGPANKLGVVAFTLTGLHPHDIAAVLDTHNIAIRAGLHCAMPLHQRLEHPEGSVRASFCLYNTKEDIDKLADGLLNAITILG